MSESTLADGAGSPPPESLGTAAARNLATTTKTEPQMQGITSRWLLRVLPWVEVAGGVYRVNRRRSYALHDGIVSFTSVGADFQVIPQELTELVLFYTITDDELLSEAARRFTQRELAAGDVLVEQGEPSETIFLIAHGKVGRSVAGQYGSTQQVDTLADGDHFGALEAALDDDTWTYTATALTPTTVLTLDQAALQELVERSPELQARVETIRTKAGEPQNTHGEAEIALTSGLTGEPVLSSTFVDYELSPREYELSVAQTVLRVHSRVADLYNQPMNQTEQQLRLTVEALREREEDELVNNREFGLLHNVDTSQRVRSRSGAPTPDDFDDLLATVWRDPGVFLAHPKTIAAFGRECNRRGVYPVGIEFNGHQVPAWRGIPLLPCNKIPVSGARTSSVLLMRLGEKNQGVVGLHQTGIPDEVEPGLNVRFMNVDEKGIISYLVSAYYSAAVLVPDAIGLLEDVQIDATV